MKRGRATLVTVAGAGCLVLSACGGTGATTGRVTSLAAPAALVTPSAGVSPSAGSLLSPSANASAGVTPSPSAVPSPSPTALGKGEGAVSVLALNGYVEYGGSDPKVNWLSPFERQTGCKVRLTSVPTSREMEVALAKQTFDVVSASPDVAGRLIDERKALPLTTSLIPAYDEIPSWLRHLPAVRSGDQVYGVPYLWGYYQLLYDTTKARPKDWAALFADRGPVMLRDSPLTIADAALALTGRLKVKDPFQLTPEQLTAAVALVAGRKGDDRAYWREPIDVLERFAPDRLRLAEGLPYHLSLLKRAGKQVRAAALPRTTGWADSWMISAGTRSPNCAYRWIAYMTSQTVQRQAAAWEGLAPANLKACVGRARRMCDAYQVTDSAVIREIAFADRPGKDCEGLPGECTDYAEWARRWQELVK